MEVDLIRATEEEKQLQIEDAAQFQNRHPAKNAAALKRLQDAALRGDNIFEELMETVKWCSLGQISDALFAVGGQYRRNM